MDFPYLEPMDVVFRSEEDRFSSYPQVPQLWQERIRIWDWNEEEPESLQFNYKSIINTNN